MNSNTACAMHGHHIIILTYTTDSFIIIYVQVRLIMNPSERQKILDSCHRDPTSGHLGVRRTLSRITERYMWTGVSNDVTKMVRSDSYLICETIMFGLAIGCWMWCLSADRKENQHCSTRTESSSSCISLAPHWHRLHWSSFATFISRMSVHTDS